MPDTACTSVTYWTVYRSMSGRVAGAGLSVSEGSPGVSGLRPPTPATLATNYLTNIDSLTYKTSKSEPEFDGLGGVSYAQIKTETPQGFLTQNKPWRSNHTTFHPARTTRPSWTKAMRISRETAIPWMW